MYYLIETIGDNRQIWGPYSIEKAKKECGSRHVICESEELENGQVMTRGELMRACQSGRIRPLEVNLAGFCGE